MAYPNTSERSDSFVDRGSRKAPTVSAAWDGRGVIVVTDTSDAVKTSTRGDGIDVGVNDSGLFSVGETPEDVTNHLVSFRMDDSLESGRMQFPVGEDLREDLFHPEHYSGYPGFPETTKVGTDRGRHVEDDPNHDGFVRRSYWNGGTNR